MIPELVIVQWSSRNGLSQILRGESVVQGVKITTKKINIAKRTDKDMGDKAAN